MRLEFYDDNFSEILKIRWHFRGQNDFNLIRPMFSKLSLPRTITEEYEDSEYCTSATEHDMKPESYWAVGENRYPRLA